jgi:hypothetical protein
MSRLSGAELAKGRSQMRATVIALSPIGVRAIGDEPFISLHEFTHDPLFLA